MQKWEYLTLDVRYDIYGARIGAWNGQSYPAEAKPDFYDALSHVWRARLGGQLGITSYARREDGFSPDFVVLLKRPKE